MLAIARRTVTQSFKAAQISDDFRQVFSHIPHVGRKGPEIFDRALELILKQLKPILMVSSKIHLVLDDSPTKRYGKKIEEAPIRHRTKYEEELRTLLTDNFHIYNSN